MATLIFLSSLISLISIFLLFFNKKKNITKKIPTWFLAEHSQINAKKAFLLKKPPWIFPILIVFITIIFCLLYSPEKKDPSEKEDHASHMLVWLDPSVSAFLSRKNMGIKTETIAGDILQKNMMIFGLDNHIRLEDLLSDKEYILTPLNTKAELITFLEKQSNNEPSPFSSNLDPKKFAKTVEKMFAKKIDFYL
ncbi:MAG: hypothetical protein K2X39_10660, partial [Silvanigrellaceae bacterium]|nr:hypothetical protein [Silvanigrellaceae bacterium]